MKTIRNLVLSFLLVLFSSFMQQSPIYQHLGTFNHPFNYNTNVNLSSYVTKHYNNNPNYSGFRYVFYLKMISNSHNQGILTSTWLYGTRVYVDGMEVPNGLTLHVRTTETIIYTWYTNNEHVGYGIKWDDAVYDPRNVK